VYVCCASAPLAPAEPSPNDQPNENGTVPPAAVAASETENGATPAERFADAATASEPATEMTTEAFAVRPTASVAVTSAL
jgi:hypothetical protein